MPLHMGEDVLGRQAALPVDHRQAHGLHRRTGGCFIQSALHIGKLPKSRQQAGFRPLPQGDLSVSFQQEHGFFLHPPLLFRLFHRQGLCCSPLSAQTQAAYGAVIAPGSGIGPTDCGPQLHHGLIENADVRRFLRHDLRQRRPDSPLGFRIRNVIVAVRQPGHDPEHVAVHRRFPPSEGCGGNGGGGIVSDPRQGQQAVIGVRKAAQRRDLPCRLLQVSGPAVIAKALPQLHEQLLVCLRQRLHCGEHRQKTGIIA